MIDCKYSESSVFSTVSLGRGVKVKASKRQSLKKIEFNFSFNFKCCFEISEEERSKNFPDRYILVISTRVSYVEKEKKVRCFCFILYNVLRGISLLLLKVI